MSVVFVGQQLFRPVYRGFSAILGFDQPSFVVYVVHIVNIVSGVSDAYNVNGVHVIMVP